MFSIRFIKKTRFVSKSFETKEKAQAYINKKNLKKFYVNDIYYITIG